jgi:two-component system sensor histidine kinase VicK
VRKRTCHQIHSYLLPKHGVPYLPIGTLAITRPLPFPVPTNSLAAENQALRDRIRQFEAQQATTPTQPSEDDPDAQSQARFRTVFENSPLGQKIIAPDLTIRQANAALVAMLGCTHRDQVQGQRILDFAHPQYRADWHHLQTQLWAHQLPYFTLETCLIRVDGTYFWCQVHSILFPDQGQDLGYTTLIDTTEHKELQASLQRLYDTQETILHLVAHDVRNSLAHVQLGVALLRQSQGAELPKFLSIIDQAATQAHAILQDVLYIGALDAAQLPKQPTDLHTYLDTQLAAHRLAAQAKEIALVLELPPAPLKANLNLNKFSRVVDNLLANALKFTPTGGRITVRLGEHKGRPQLAVQDTGVGIPAEYQAHLFDKFSQAAREGLAGESTTGLGLFITQQIVRLHGGKIWVESREHEGTTFFIDF